MISSKWRTQVDQLRRQLSLRFFTMRYYTLPEVGTLTRKKRLVMNWYSSLGHGYIFFNVIVSRLVALMTLKSQKCLSLFPVKAHQISAPDPKLQKQWLCNNFFLYKTQSSSKKQTLVKVLGQILVFISWYLIGDVLSNNNWS